MLDIVVAHYNEDITWIKKIKSNKINKIFVYSKGEPNKINDKKIKQLNPKIIHNYRPNIGRESETYLRFCYENYNNLSDGVIFLQGTPHVGIREIISWIDNLTVNYSHTPNYMVASIYYEMLTGKISYWANSLCKPSQYNCFTFMREYISSTVLPYDNKIYIGANFGVSKTCILSRDKIFYLNIIDKELGDINPEAGHFCERLWFYIFNCHKGKDNA